MADYLRVWEAAGAAAYLEAATRLFDYWCARTGPDRVPPWDFDDPAGPRDTSAAAIVAEGLARLAVQPVLAARAPALVARLPPMLGGLLGHLTPDGRLVDGCFNRPRRFAERSECCGGARACCSRWRRCGRGGCSSRPAGSRSGPPPARRR